MANRSLLLALGGSRANIAKSMIPRAHAPTRRVGTNALLGIAALANRQETQYFNKLSGLPLMEHSPSLKLIHTSEVGPAGSHRLHEQPSLERIDNTAGVNEYQLMEVRERCEFIQGRIKEAQKEEAEQEQERSAQMTKEEQAQFDRAMIEAGTRALLKYRSTINDLTATLKEGIACAEQSLQDVSRGSTWLKNGTEEQKLIDKGVSAASRQVLLQHSDRMKRLNQALSDSKAREERQKQAHLEVVQKLEESREACRELKTLLETERLGGQDSAKSGWSSYAPAAKRFVAFFLVGWVLKDVWDAYSGAFEADVAPRDSPRMHEPVGAVSTTTVPSPEEVPVETGVATTPRSVGLEQNGSSWWRQTFWKA